MPIDTSSYYPEVPDNDVKEEYLRLNDRNMDLFSLEKESGDASESAAAVITAENESAIVAEDKEKVTPEPEKPETSIEKAVTMASHILSWVLVPLLMPVFGVILAFSLSVILTSIPAGSRVGIVFIVAGINILIPAVFVILLKRLGLIEDVGLNGQKERLVPYIITTICFGITAWLMAMWNAPLWVVMFFAGGALAALINMAVNFKWKISAHAAAIAGVVALLVKMPSVTFVSPRFTLWLLITIGAAGLLGSSRIWLGRHTVWQVIAGYAVGFCSVFFLMYI